MTDSLPIEVRAFTELLEAMSKPQGDASPAISAICRALRGIVPNAEKDPARILFDYIQSIDTLIEEHMLTPGSKRSGSRLRARIGDLFGSERLHQRYDAFQNEQRENILAILDLLPLLDDVQFNSSRLVEVRTDINESLLNIISDIAQSDQLSEATKRVVKGQVELIQKTLDRFEFEGVVPFRDSIFCTIGRLTIELRTSDEKQGAAIRKVVDDLIRVKEMIEVAGGALLLSGPVIAGLLSGPAS